MMVQDAYFCYTSVRNSVEHLMHARLNILGIPVDTLTAAEIEDRLRMFLLTDTLHHIVTVNPEIVMWAQQDREYRSLLQTAALCLPDGVGLVLAARMRQSTIKRMTGWELTHRLLRVAQEEHARVAVLGGDGHVTHVAALRMKKEFPGVQIIAAEAGPKIRIEHGLLRLDEGEHQLLVEHLRALKPDILLVGYGHPKQEKWIQHIHHELPSVKIAVGIGGVIDYLSGHVMRAPAVLRYFGLEWLFRLMRQPWRLPRIYTATVKFLLAVKRERQEDGIDQSEI